MFFYKVKDYIKEFDVYLALNAVKHKSHNNLQFLLVFNYY